LKRLLVVVLGGAGQLLFYDENNRLIRTETENRDELGDLDVVNPMFTNTFTYIVGNSELRADKIVNMTEEIDENTTRTTLFEYTGNGKRKKVTDPEGNITEIEYDERDLVFKTTRAVGTLDETTEQRDYTLFGKLAKVINGEGHETNFVFDAFERQIEVVDALGNKDVFGYDKKDNRILLERRDSLGKLLANQQ